MNLLSNSSEHDVQDAFATMALRDLSDEATEEEHAYLRSDENVEEWHSWLSTYIVETDVLLRAKRAEFENMRREYTRSRPRQDWEEYKRRHFDWFTGVEAARLKALKRAHEAKRLVKDLKRRRHLVQEERRLAKGTKDERLRAALDHNVRQRNEYRKQLIGVQKQLLEVPEFFSEVGEPMRQRLLAQVDGVLWAKDSGP